VNIEITEDSSYTFLYTKVTSGTLTPTISTAYLRILGSDGTEYKASSAMTTSTNTASLSVNFATDPTDKTYSRGRNYQVEYTIDSEKHVRFFDLVRYPFVNEVIDQDLIDENIMLMDGLAEQEGQAQSGTTATLVDLARTEADDYWNGGKLTKLPLLDTGVVTEHQITDFVKSTNTLTFTPVTTAITTERYFIRRSYKGLTDRAADKVRAKVAAQGEPAYLLIDGTSVKQLIVYMSLAMWFQQKREAEGDKYDMQFKYYEDQFQKQFDTIPLVFDVNDDGKIDDDEAKGQNFMSVSLSR
jgi:hypothetical protein